MEPTETSERLERLKRIGADMDEIVRDVGPKLIRLAHLRSEARSIMGEIGEKQGG